jgi:hypothetical protein
MTTLLALAPSRSPQRGVRSCSRLSGAVCLGSVPEDLSQAFAALFRPRQPAGLAPDLCRRSGNLENPIRCIKK